MLKTSSKELLRAVLLGQKVDRVPFAPNLAYLFETLPEGLQKLGHMGFSRMVGADQLNRFGPCPVKVILPPDASYKTCISENQEITEITTPVGKLRQAYTLSPQGNTSFITEHPLKCEDDYKTAMWIEENTVLKPDFDMAKLCFSEYPEALNIGMLIPRGQKSAFQYFIETLVGTEEMIYNLFDFPDTVKTLWQMMVEKNIEAVRLAADSEYEFFITWEDSSTQNYSPEMYESFIAEEIKQWTTVLRDAGKHYIQHACGHVGAILPAMNTQGINSIESLSPIPTGNISLKDARKKLDPNIGIIGGIEPTELLNCSLSDLPSYVEQVISDADGGPFILGNADSCPPGVTVEKFKLISEIAKNYKV